MNHRPFEEWLLDDEKLSPEQDQTLQEHLKACETCTLTSQAWQDVKHAMNTTPQAAPLPGFTPRWQAYRIARQAAQQRRLAWSIFGVCLALVLAGLVLVYGPEIVQLSPGALLSNLLLNATLFIVRSNHTRDVIEMFTGGISPLLPAAIWIAATSSLAGLSLIWIFAMWKIIVPKGVRS